MALIGVPSAITAMLSPGGMAASEANPVWVDVVGFAFMLLALIGQLALIRMALKPSVTVAGAISHGARRMPINLAAALMVAFGLVILAIPFVLVAAPGGVPDARTIAEMSATGWLLLFLFLAVCLYIGVRMLMTSTTAAAEHGGPIHVLKRSWALTSGHFWRLFAFLLLFLIAAILIIIVLGIIAGSIATLLFGPIEKMTLSSLFVGIVQGLFNAMFTTVFAVLLTRLYVQLSGRDTIEAPAAP